MFEVVGFITARYISPPQERWYDYLWYIPATINSLRGFGIFFILVLTPETRSKIIRVFDTLKEKSSRVLGSRDETKGRGGTFLANEGNNSRNMSLSMQSSVYGHNYAKTRNMSVATTITNLPVLHQDRPHSKLVHSVSQMERRPSTTSSMSSFSELEDLENMEAAIAGGRRRSNAAAVVALPSVGEDEELSLTPISIPGGGY